MYNDENDAVALARRLTIYDYVLIDTCSLMEDSFPMWMDRLAAAKVYLSDSPTQIYVPKECIIELERHSKNKEDFNKRATAKRALIILKKAKKQKLVTILKKQKKEPKSKAFADRAIYVKVSADRSNQKILVVTQDKKLASDLIALNNLLSQKGRYAHVVKFDAKSGELVPNRGETSHENNNHRSENHAPNKDNAEKSSVSPKPISAGLGGQRHGLIRPSAPAKKSGNKAEAADETKTNAPAKSAEAPVKKEPPKKAENSAPIERKAEEAKPVEKKNDAPAVEKKKESKLPFRFGMGGDVETALSNCAFSAGLMFRYPSIPYLPQFHGPVDLTEIDWKEILVALDHPTSEAKQFSTKGLLWRAEQLTPRSIRVTVERKDEPKEAISKKATESEAKLETPVPHVAPSNKEAKPAPKKESPSAQAPVMSEEEYAAGKAKILAEKDFVSSRAINAIFHVGPYRGNKILKRLQSEAVLSDVADPSRGFRVLKEVEEDVESISLAKPLVPENTIVSETKAKEENKAPHQNANNAKKSSAPKAEAHAKPASDVSVEKDAPKAEKVSAPKAKAPAKKKASPSKQPAKKENAPKNGKPEEKPASPAPKKTSSNKGQQKKASPAKKEPASSKPVSDNADHGRLIVLTPSGEGEKKPAGQKASNKPKEKNASITVKGGKKASAPKAKNAFAPSEAFIAVKKKEDDLEKILADASASKDEVLAALNQQLSVIEPLTPAEKRKLRYHKTQLLLLKKELN